MCLRQLVVSPALIREYSRHMRRHVPTLGACRGLGSRRLPARLKDVCAEIDPISAFCYRDECEQCQKSRGRLVVLGIVNVVSACRLDTVPDQDLTHGQCRIFHSVFAILLLWQSKVLWQLRMHKNGINCCFQDSWRHSESPIKPRFFQLLLGQSLFHCEGSKCSCVFSRLAIPIPFWRHGLL